MLFVFEMTKSNNIIHAKYRYDDMSNETKPRMRKSRIKADFFFFLVVFKKILYAYRLSVDYETHKTLKMQLVA